MKAYTQSIGPEIQARGHKMAKKRNPIFVHEQPEPFSVVTASGTQTGEAGDFLVYDPLSGDVWPVSAAYAKLHYEDF